MTPDPFKWKPKPARLTDLRVREISSVDRGAGEDVKVAFWKRDDDARDGDLAEQLLVATKALQLSLAAIRDDDALDAQGRDLASQESFEQFHKYVVAGFTAADDEDDETIYEQTEKGSTMPHLFDAIEFSKRVLAGEPTACTKADIFVEMQKRADAQRRPDETRAQSFARFVMTDREGRALYDAHKVVQGPDYRPEPQVTKAVRPSSAAPMAKADELRKADPANNATREIAFAKVYADPANRALVAAERAENRPSAPVEKGDRSTVGDHVARLAAALARAHRDLTHDEAIERVLTRNPLLAEAYRREQAGEAA